MCTHGERIWFGVDRWPKAKEKLTSGNWNVHFRTHNKAPNSSLLICEIKSASNFVHPSFFLPLNRRSISLRMFLGDARGGVSACRRAESRESRPPLNELEALLFPWGFETPTRLAGIRLDGAPLNLLQCAQEGPTIGTTRCESRSR
jgi:hypothetical protein